jgi:hypothetical protein
MRRRGTFCLVALLLMTSLTTLSYASDEFLIPKKEFSASVKRLQIVPVVDSLRESDIAMIEQIDKGVTLSEEAMKDPGAMSMFEKTKNTMKVPYYLAAKILKLTEKNSRDSIKTAIDGKIRSAFERCGKYSLDTLNNFAKNIPDSSVYAFDGKLCVALRLENTTINRTRRGGKVSTVTYTCAIVLSAWVYAKDGKPYWHNQKEIAQILPNDTMGSLLNDDSIDDAIKSVFKKLIK